MEHNTIAGMIFDLDGTLLDSTGMWHQIDRQLLTHYGREIPPDISDVVRKMSIQESSSYFVQRFDLPCTPAEFSAFVSELAAKAYREELQLKPGVISLLDWLEDKGIIFGVATATYGELAKAALQRLGIWERLTFLLTEEEIGAPKTDPLIFRTAAQRMHLGRRQIAVVEDSLHAVETAKAAGFFTVGVYDAASRMDWNAMCATATVHIRELSQLKEIFR